MRFENSVRHLLLFMLFGFGAVMASAVYWAVVGPESTLNHPTNYRLRNAAASVIRGEILDRDDTVLVESLIGADGFVTRSTRDSSLFSLTGYSSRQYGFSGAEAVYNAALSGASLTDSLNDAIQHDLLHIPRQGSDIRLSIKFETQQATADALAQLGVEGAAVVMDAHTGDLLAVVSTPAVDPTALDSQWASLIIDPDKPFVNRATQGQYIPGSALSPAILTAWVIDGRSLNAILPVNPDGEASPCNPATGELAVRAAFNFGCTETLTEMAVQLGKSKFDTTASLFGLYTPVTLDTFTLPATTAQPLQATLSPDAPVIEQLALDQIRLSPLDMAVMISAIANGGNAPRPRLLQATRAPEAQNWSPVPATGQSTAVTTAQTAAIVANAMRDASAEGLAATETCHGTDIGATIGISQSEDSSTVFFTGFARLADGHTVVAVIAAEGIDLIRTPDVAAAGNKMLCAALAGYAEG